MIKPQPYINASMHQNKTLAHCETVQYYIDHNHVSMHQSHRCQHIRKEEVVGSQPTCITLPVLQWPAWGPTSSCFLPQKYNKQQYTMHQDKTNTTVVLMPCSTLKDQAVLEPQPAYTILPMYNVTMICLGSYQLLLLYYKPMITPANTIIPVLSLINR